MKRPVLKRIVKLVEIVTWTLEYEDVPDALEGGERETAVGPTAPTTPESDSKEQESFKKISTTDHSPFIIHNYSGDQP